MPTSFADFFLEEEPRSAFFSAIAPFTTTQLRRNLFQNLFPQVQNQFLGALGQQARQGQTPNMPFVDFLGEQDWNKWFFQQPRWGRGASAQQFNPRTRFMLGF